MITIETIDDDARPLVLIWFLFLVPLLWAHAQVDDACPLGAITALSFDADQARKAEWHTAYPEMPPLALSADAVRRAEAFPPPPPPPGDGD